VTARISVVIPVYNGAETIADAISSVATQSHRNLELFVVDDGSTDNSVEIAKSAIIEAGVEGKVLSRPLDLPRGAGACRNYGVTFGDGEFFAFLDADDIWVPTHLESAMQVFSEQSAEMGAYSSMCQQIDAAGRELNLMPELGFPVAGLCDALPFLLEGMFIPTVTLCVRRSAFRATTGFSESLSCYEDWWFVLQLAARAKIYFHTIVGCRIRVNAGSLTRAPSTHTRVLSMSDAMYSDQLVLLTHALGASFLSGAQLGRLRHSIVNWNARQLSDLASSAQFGECTRILRALRRAGSLALLGDIVVNAGSDLVRRLGRKVIRMSAGTRSL